MTSTVSSNNKNFTRLYQWAFARNKRIMIVFSLLMVTGIMIVLFRQTLTNDVEAFEQIGAGSIVFAQVGAVLFSIISSSLTFSFLHNKRSTDMFGAIPATRSTLYFAHLLGGMTAVSIPFTAGCLGTMLLTCRSVKYLTIDLAFILFGLMNIAAIYSFSALVAYCCGTTRDSTIINFAVNAIYVGVVVIFINIADFMIPGLYFDHSFYTPVLTLFSPMLFSFFFDYYVFADQATAIWSMVIWSILYTLVVVLLGNYTAKTRKAETAQSEFNVKWLPVVIKIGMSVLSGSFAGIITTASLMHGFSNMYTFAFWYIIIGFVTLFIFHLIFARGLKGKFVPTLIAYACTTAGVLGLIFAMSSGLGIDTYVPDVSNIKSVTFSRETYYDPENIETITEIHRLIIEGVQKERPRPYFLGNSGNYHDGNSDYTPEKYPVLDHTDFSFSYTKKIGFTTDRKYTLSVYNGRYYDFQKLKQLLEKLCHSAEYKQLIKSSLWESESARRYGVLPENITLTSYDYRTNNSSYVQSNVVHLRTNEEFVEGLYKALKADILADDRFYLKVFGEKYYPFSTYIGYHYAVLEVFYGSDQPGRVFEGDYGTYVTPAKKNIRVIITDDYTNTLNYIETYETQ